MKISLELSVAGIDKAIAQFAQFEKRLKDRNDAFVKRMCERGAELAKEECPEDTGALKASIRAEADGGSGRYCTDNGHAAYVEFGTGIVGQNAPHPTMPWAYDVNGHGEAGWLYPSDDGWIEGKDGTKYAWTKGMPARPYMLNSALRLQEEIPQIASEVFGHD